MLRKIGILVAALALALGVGIALPSVTGVHVGSVVGITQVQADSGASQYCSANNDFGVSHGACVSFFESNGNSSAVNSSICKQLTYPFTFVDGNGNTVTLKNHGDCVSYLNQFKHG